MFKCNTAQRSVMGLAVGILQIVVKSGNWQHYQSGLYPDPAPQFLHKTTRILYYLNVLHFCLNPLAKELMEGNINCLVTFPDFICSLIRLFD